MLFNNKIFLETDIRSGELPTHDQIEEKYTWNLNDIYASEEEYEKDYLWLKENGHKIKDFEGRLGENAEVFYECFKFEEEIGIKLGKVYLYAMLAKDLNLSDSQSLERYDKVLMLHAQISEYESFIQPEILSLSEEKVFSFLDEKEELKIYRHQLEDMFRRKPHTLTKDQERLMALALPVTEVPYNAFTLLENTDLKFPTVKDEEGNEIEISHGRYGAALYSNDRSYRKRVYKGFYKPIIEHKNTFSALFNGNIKAKIFGAKARNYESTLHAALTPNNIPIQVYTNLIENVKENLKPLHRWAEIKKRVLGLDELHPYDAYVTLFPTVSRKYTFEEGKELVLKALEPMGGKYIDRLKHAFDNRWLDVFETKNKRSGAYSSGTTYGVHPYVLLNWNDNLNDVFTLAHEMGHCLHSHLTIENQPYPYADYTIFLAEVASTTNEALLLNYLIENAESAEEKKYLIEKFLLNAVTTFYRQTRFAEFELITHRKSERGEAHTPDSLCALYGNLYKEYWGDAMKVDPEEEYTWARVPHFYYNFYVYQYATGFAASESLASNILSEGLPAVDRYLNFLKSGSSKYSIDILKDAGVDMTDRKPVLAVVKKFNKLIDELETLL